jgi:GNAT superfamily N-acetyltransferase
MPGRNLLDALFDTTWRTSAPHLAGSHQRNLLGREGAAAVNVPHIVHGRLRVAQTFGGATTMPDKGGVGTNEWHETVRGGEHVHIRPFQAADKALYADFLRDVSADDLRLRFFARIAELSAEEADKLTHLDGKHEMAFIALDENTGHMLGLVRLKAELDEKTAEFAVLVRSRLKGHGLGWLLMQHVIDYAKHKGFRRVFGDVLTENSTMLQMCAELGFHQMDMGPDLRRVVLDL